MAIEVIWTPAIEEEFIRLAGLSEEEAAIIRIRHNRYGRIKDRNVLEDMGYPMSIDQYDKYVSDLKKKYDLVQPMSYLLHIRGKNKREAFENARKNTIKS